VGTEDASFDALIDYIKSNRGFDFTGYKRPSLERRIQRRMQEHRLESYDEYRTYLDEHPDEFVDLFNTILINVTAFFRDVPAWEYVRAEIVPRIVEESQDRGGIRVWSTGCASGEEAYTLAIAFAEALSGGSFAERVKIYATDVDEEALSEGRHGIYPAARVENVPADLRERYFEHVDDRYVVKPELRRGVIFGRHDIVQDPPISRIDLLASRNTLMYFKKEAQARILANFHFALRGGGYLFLGKSEMMLARSDLFHPVDVKRRLFQKTGRERQFELPPRPLLEPRRERATERMMQDVGFETAPIAAYGGLKLTFGGIDGIGGLHAASPTSWTVPSSSYSDSSVSATVTSGTRAGSGAKRASRVLRSGSWPAARSWSSAWARSASQPRSWASASRPTMVWQALRSGCAASSASKAPA